MREIKFKFWDKRRGQFDKFLDKKNIFEIGNAYYLSHSTYLIPLQYTGLKDKNGKEIYEGDIIYTKTELIRIKDGKRTGHFKEKYAVVYFEDGCFKTKNSIGNLSKKIVEEFYEVVGNKFENPELLEITKEK